LQSQNAVDAKQQNVTSIRGKAIDTLGKPIKRAIVRVYSNGQLLKESHADENSNYEFTSMPAGKFTLKIAAKSGYKNVTGLERAVELQTGQNLVLDLVGLDIPDHWSPLESEISGIVLQTDLSVIKGARIRLVNPFYGETIKEVVADENGKYYFKVSMQGQYFVQAYYPGFMVGSEVILAVGDKYSRNVVLRPIR
jgi:hypothetical protein